MTLSVSRLLDIGLNVDTSGLESFLGQIRDRLDGLQDRVADLENDGSVLTKDEVKEIVDDALSGTADEDHSHDDYASQYDLDSLSEKVDDLETVTEDRVQELINNTAYDAVSDQVYDMVKDVVREDLDEKDFADRDHDHDGSYASVDDHNELAERVGVVESTQEAFADHEGRIETLEQRLDVYANKADNAALNLGEWRAEDLAALGQRIERLEGQSAEHQGHIERYDLDAMFNRIVALEEARTQGVEGRLAAILTAIVGILRGERA